MSKPRRKGLSPKAVAGIIPRAPFTSRSIPKPVSSRITRGAVPTWCSRRPSQLRVLLVYAKNIERRAPLNAHALPVSFHSQTPLELVVAESRASCGRSCCRILRCQRDGLMSWVSLVAPQDDPVRCWSTSEPVANGARPPGWLFAAAHAPVPLRHLPTLSSGWVP